ncbi:hypothetical protein DFH07DRAFT_769056 [Mycena maculata]|uniref:Uncharacterized protein n=1 Tax=Mycena maculata TaxID=230809 RepID=A0AAD7JSA7_9AGAR|nr:hypothetical protein DFH07DRAFT_769056 [Mycena maculata]
MASDDSTRCLGRDPDGHQCICMRCTKTHVVDERTLCSNCGHIESAHPEPRVAVTSLVRQYRDAGRLHKASDSSSKAKATQSEAEAETNGGLKKKRKSGTDTEPPVKGSSSRGKKKEENPTKRVKGEDVEVGHVAVLVRGTRGKPDNLTLAYSKAPNQRDLDNMRKYKLAVMATPEQPLTINTAWNTERCDKFFRTLFPDLFRHLARHPPKADLAASEEVQQQQWLAVLKQHQSVQLATDPLPTGAILAQHAKRKGHSISERVIFIATKNKVSSERYEDWNVESDSEGPEPEEGSSDFDMLDQDEEETPRKAAPKSKGKGKPKSQTLVNASVAVKLEKEDPILLDSDMKMAAKMRTRLDSKAIKKKKFLIPNSSDDERPQVIEVSDEEDFPEPSTLSASLPASSLPAPNTWTSPLFTSFDKSPSPAQDSSNLFDDTDFFSVPPSPTSNISAHSSGWASTSSLISSASQNEAPAVLDASIPLPSFMSIPTPFTSSNWASSSSLPNPGFTGPTAPTAASTSRGWTSSSVRSNANADGPSSTAGPSRLGAFLTKHGGRSKGLINPWKH